ncbi:hypothetical protein PAXRUDRAFT_831730 [Paxillus rubicundulus Ve08.2h10]|uniref:Protein kinase domain-containing protein n=1 Tax=Paxillus rubicundulus Ve08.2h10 TaxID=930991 RepID=A0A0D0D0S7_9AGAM|nr:hypothetical protein PAXRUDRAFT_831730 [Paxillus rubicundulus Ve08.2h10]
MSSGDRTGKKTDRKAEADRRTAQRAQKEVSVFGTNYHLSPEELDSREVWWRVHYEQLKARGYLLRPRYSPEWVPSWTNTKKDWLECEDGKRLRFAQIIDATRISDGKFVTLKRINQAVHPYEVTIAQYFSSDTLASQAANHCVPIYEAFTLDDANDVVVIVMPLLRAYTDPQFDTIGEGVECVRQLFEGLHYIHKHHVAHRDCMNRNLMLDPSGLYPHSFHPMESSLNRDYSGHAKHFTRTQRPPKYYFIDFGISRRYAPSETVPKEVPIWGGDKEVPEFQGSNEPCNPFPTDVFYIGNALKKDFIQMKQGFEFMQPLVADMIQADPSKRPTMDDVVARFEGICRGLSGWKLRSRVVDKDEDVFERVTRTTSHWTRRIGFVARGVPAIPAPPS